MNIKKITALLSAVAILTVGFTACSKDSDKPSSESSEGTSESTAETDAVKESVGTIKWLSYYDLNPSGGDDRSAALTIFEDAYGGKIEWIPTTNDNKYEDLSKLVLAGEQVDMFPYEEDEIIKGIYENMYQPLDDYIDLESELWADMKNTADSLMYKGAHYVVPYSIEDPVCVIYSRKMIKDAKLDDPYELYKQGKWDWDSFMSMMKTFTEESDDDAYGCTGWLGQAVFRSTGKPVVSYDGTKFTNNTSDANIEKAGLFLEEISSSGLFNDSWQTYFPDNGETLFYVMAPWALGESNAANADEDIFIVPFPKMPGADKYYASCDYGAKMLVSGSENAEAVAKYIECERMAVTDEGYKAAAKKLALTPTVNIAGEKTSFITEEQYDAVQSFTAPEGIQPLFDFGFGMGRKMSGNSINYDSRGAMRNLTDGLVTGYDGSPSSWESLRDSLIKVIDEEISSYN